MRNCEHYLVNVLGACYLLWLMLNGTTSKPTKILPVHQTGRKNLWDSSHVSEMEV